MRGNGSIGNPQSNTYAKSVDSTKPHTNDVTQNNGDKNNNSHNNYDINNDGDNDDNFDNICFR